MAYPEKGAKYAGEARASKLCRAEGGGVSDAERELGKSKLQRAFQDRALEDLTLQGQSRRLQDSVEMSRDAYQRGDYAPTGRGGLNYKPWNPKRGEE